MYEYHCRFIGAAFVEYSVKVHNLLYIFSGVCLKLSICHAELFQHLNSIYYETLKQACPGVRPGFRVTNDRNCDRLKTTLA
jgi:hypothetical protein